MRDNPYDHPMAAIMRDTVSSLPGWVMFPLTYTVEWLQAALGPQFEVRYIELSDEGEPVHKNGARYMPTAN